MLKGTPSTGFKFLEWVTINGEMIEAIILSDTEYVNVAELLEMFGEHGRQLFHDILQEDSGLTRDQLRKIFSKGKARSLKKSTHK